jgi:hypothetical protein
MMFVLPEVLINVVLGYLTDMEIAYVWEWPACQSLSETKRVERVRRAYSESNGLPPEEYELLRHDYNCILIEFVFVRYVCPRGVQFSLGWLVWYTRASKHPLLSIQNIALFQRHLASQLDPAKAEETAVRLWTLSKDHRRLDFLRALVAFPDLSIPTWVLESFIDSGADTTDLLILYPEVRLPQLMECVARQAIRTGVLGPLKILAAFPQMKWTTSLCHLAMAQANLCALRFMQSLFPADSWSEALYTVPPRR